MNHGPNIFAVHAHLSSGECSQPPSCFCGYLLDQEAKVKSLLSAVARNQQESLSHKLPQKFVKVHDHGPVMDFDSQTMNREKFITIFPLWFFFAQSLTRSLSNYMEVPQYGDEVA